MINRQVVLKSYVQGAPTPQHFSMRDAPMPEIQEGEFLVKNRYFSLEPAIRGWLEGKANYFDPIPLQGVVRGPSVAEVIESRNSKYAAGDIIFGLNHWEDYSVCSDETILIEKLAVEPGVPLSYYVGPLGGSGTTAYVGLHEIGHIQSGQTVVISAAAGATGSIAGQVAKLRGCRVIGIVGSDEKADLITKEFGFDAAVNYKTSQGIADEINALVPDGVDIYYDNVGGPILNEMLLTMKSQGRIVCCGMIADYSRTEDPNPITNLWEVVARQLTMQGFLLFTFHDKVPAAQAQLAKWIQSGDIKVVEHISKGLEKTPEAFSELMTGSTIGKALVELG